MVKINKIYIEIFNIVIFCLLKSIFNRNRKI
jgi:hypothetical protein